MIAPAGHRLFRDLCLGARSTILTTHVNPDGDALGSQLGLARFLADRGRKVRIVNPDPTPDNLRFLEAHGPVVEVYDRASHDDALRDVELLVLVDNAAPDRLGRMEDALVAAAGHTLCIDHHPTRGTPWAYQILDEESCATAMMVYELARACDWVPERAAAEALYVGLATDTGFFRFNSTSVRAHEVAAELLARGVAPARVYQAIHERNSLAYTRLLGHALAELTLDAGGAIAVVALPLALVRSLGAEEVDAGEAATSLLAVDGVVVALLFRELAEGRVKVSLRSKAGFDVHRLAGEFGGGGHRNASGIVMSGGLDAVRRAVVERAGAALAAGRAGKGR